MPMLDELRFSRMLFRAVAAPVAALAVLAALLAWQVTRLLSVNSWVARTDRALAEACGLGQLMVEMERGERHYLLSGNPEFRGRWASAEPRLEPTLDRLAGLVADDSLQKQRIADIRGSLRSWTDAARAALDARDQDIMRSESREATVDGLLGRVEAFIQTETSLRNARSRRAELTGTLTLGGTLCGTLLVGLAIGIYSRRQLLGVTDLYESAVTARELVLQSVGDGIYGLDTAGRIMFLNPAGASLLGFTPAEALGRDAHALFHHSTADGRSCSVERCPADITLHDGVIRRVDDEVFWRKDGSSFAVAYVSTPIRRQGALEGAVVSFRDITEEKEREAERQRLLEQAEEGVRARDHVLGIASHELRTPMTSLKLHIDLLSKVIDRPLSSAAEADVRDRLGSCKRQIARLEKLVDELLTAGYVRAGKIDLKRENVDLAQLVSECTGELASQIEAAGCSLRLDLDGPTIGTWDRSKLERIVLNLVSNAIEFGKGRPVDISLRNEGTEAILTVRDRGGGVREEDRERIFRPLEKPDIAHHAHGLGLGLYISRELARATGGTLGVLSTPGPGSAFFVRLPR